MIRRLLVVASIFVLLLGPALAGEESPTKEGDGDSYFGSLIAAIGTPGELLLKALLEKLSHPQSCFPCIVLHSVSNVLSGISETAYSLISVPIGIVLPVCVAVWIAVRAARYFAALSASMERTARPWKDMLESGGLFLVAAIATGLLATDNSYSVLSSIVYQLVLLGASGASAVSDIFHDILSVTHATTVSIPGIPATTIIVPANPAEEGQVYADYLMPSVSSDPADLVLYYVLVLAGAMHHISAQGIGLAATYWACMHSVPNNVPHQLLLLAIGGILLLLFIVLLVSSALRLLDPLLRVFFVLALSPLLFAFLPFRTTRSLFVAGARAPLYAAVFYLITGIIFTIMFVLLAQYLGADLKWPDKSSDQFSPMCRQSGVVDIYHTLQVFLSVLVAQALVQQAGQIAGQLTDYRLQGGVGEQVGQQAMSLGRSTAMMGAYMVMAPFRR